jgi:hypothetical protein
MHVRCLCVFAGQSDAFYRIIKIGEVRVNYDY